MRIVIGEIILEGTPSELAEYDGLTGGSVSEIDPSIVRLFDDGGNVISAYEWIDGLGYVEVT
jgi:alpha-L-arabinofuranosidase